MDPKGKGKAQAEDEGEFAYNSSVHDIGGLEEEIIYSKHIRLEYTPPVELPAPFPRTLFKVNAGEDVKLRDRETQHKKGKFPYDVELHDGLVFPNDSDLFKG